MRADRESMLAERAAEEMERRLGIFRSRKSVWEALLVAAVFHPPTRRLSAGACASALTASEYQSVYARIRQVASLPATVVRTDSVTNSTTTPPAALGDDPILQYELQRTRLGETRLEPPTVTRHRTSLIAR